MTVGRSSTITAVKGAAAKRELTLASNDKWRDRDRQGDGDFEIGTMWHDHADDAAVNAAAERADHIIDCRDQRFADARLRHDHRGQHRPERPGQMQQLRKTEGENGGDGHAQTVSAIAAAVARPPTAKPGPQRVAE